MSDGGYEGRMVRGYSYNVRQKCMFCDNEFKYKIFKNDEDYSRLTTTISWAWQVGYS